MKKLVIIFLLFSSTFFSQIRLIQNIEARKTISLNGKWNVIVDPYETGYYTYRLTPDQNGFFKNQKQKNKYDRIEYDFDKSEKLIVPGDWNTQKEKLFFYEGTIWYKKSFNYEKKQNKRVFIYFGAVNYNSKVYLNGEFVGEHVGGFTPFNFEITDKINSGLNFVIVKVDNKRLPEGVPTINTDWWNYGGITRDVYLVETNSTFIDDYFIQLEKNSSNKISGWVKLDGNIFNDIKIKIPELKFDTSLTPNKNGYCQFIIDCSPVLWSPKNPKLYDVIIQHDDEVIKDKIGFRKIEVKENKIFLNDKEIFLRGISLHEETPVKSSRANSKKDARKLLSMAKELNCNFVRLAHYPHNENIIKVADRLGFLVWSEIPVYWTIHWKNKQTFENASNQLKEMISRDKNRASIIFWSVGNETPLSEERLIFMKNLIDTARFLDSTRLITAALETHYIDSKTIMINDPLGNYLDVLGCNEYIGWYDGLPQKADSIQWKTIYNKPLVISEFGGDAKYGFHSDSLTIWSEEFQESIYKHQIKMLNKISFLSGVSPWILMDFRSPRRTLPNIQDYFNRKGLYSNLGEKKKAFYILKNYYKTKMN
ncbi:MAG: beta-glucuronidase [Melioribacteraceae bacterium]|nr:beta-glucuronidase [Melioribacteraceae bacterium]